MSIVIFFAVLIFITAQKSYLFKTPIPTSKLNVTTSFYPLYFFAARIGGNKIEINNITPPGAEPHEYEPTAQDMARIESSEVLILNGGNLETWGNKILNSLDKKKTAVIIAGDESVKDPHIWLSPILAKQQVNKILKGFILKDPKNKQYYQNNADRIIGELDLLNNEYSNGLRHCNKKDFITSHIAFGYLAQTYGLNQIAIAGLSPDTEPSAKQLTEIVRFAKDHNVKYIFFESLVSPKLADTIANEIGAKTLVLDPIEGITPDDQKSGKNYITIMKDNLINLRIALECQ